MEELLIALIQFLIEFFINVFAEFPFEWASRKRNRPDPDEIVMVCYQWLFLGAVVAGVSLIVFRHTIISVGYLRIANLVLAPLTSGYISFITAKKSSKKDPFIKPRNHFWQAFWFTLSLTVIRFAYALRV